MNTVAEPEPKPLPVTVTSSELEPFLGSMETERMTLITLTAWFTVPVPAVSAVLM